MFVDKPPLASCRSTADGMTTASYNKLQPRKVGPFCVMKVQSHTVVIDKDSVPSTVFIYQITGGPGLESNHLVPKHGRV